MSRKLYELNLHIAISYLDKKNDKYDKIVRNLIIMNESEEHLVCANGRAYFKKYLNSYEIETGVGMIILSCLEYDETNIQNRFNGMIEYAKKNFDDKIKKIKEAKKLLTKVKNKDIIWK